MSLHTISKQEWDSAIQYFAQNPSEVKMRRKEQNPPKPYSFIQVEDVIYAIDREYLGHGAFSKVKKAISQYGELVKVSISAQEPKEKHRIDEQLVTRKVGEFKGQAKATFDTPKEFWKHLKGTPDEKPECKTQEKIYKIMRLHHGKELYRALYENIFSNIEYIVIAIQCAKALEEAHRLDIVHGDIKPENFILNVDTLEVSLIDYGFSKFTPKGQTSFKLNSYFGTIGYIAPEIENSGLYSFASDIYALGKMFEEDMYVVASGMTADSPEDRPSIGAVIEKLKFYASNYDDYTDRLKSIVEAKVKPLDLVRSGSDEKVDMVKTPKLIDTMRKLGLSSPSATPSSSSSPVAPRPRAALQPLPLAERRVPAPLPRDGKPTPPMPLPRDVKPKPPMPLPRDVKPMPPMPLPRDPKPTPPAPLPRDVKPMPLPRDAKPMPLHRDPKPMPPVPAAPLAMQSGGVLIFNRDLQEQLAGVLRSPSPVYGLKPAAVRRR